jgi:hypothetical protein
MNQTSPQTAIEGISRGIKALARYAVAATSLVAVQAPLRRRRSRPWHATSGHSSWDPHAQPSLCAEAVAASAEHGEPVLVVAVGAVAEAGGHSVARLHARRAQSGHQELLHLQLPGRWQGQASTTAASNRGLRRSTSPSSTSMARVCGGTKSGWYDI